MPTMPKWQSHWSGMLPFPMSVVTTGTPSCCTMERSVSAIPDKTTPPPVRSTALGLSQG